MRFYRGIAVPRACVDETITAVKTGGLTEQQGWWRMEQFHPGNLDVLLAKFELSRSDTRPEEARSWPAVCACGDLAGAQYYAWWHNQSEKNDTPLVIEFETSKDTVAVDGRDFLYTAVSRGDSEETRVALEAIFGPRILTYAERAWASKDPAAPIAFCDLAIWDPEIIDAHYANRRGIAGRHGTRFTSAFTIRLPVTSDQVQRVWVPELPSFLPRQEFSLDKLPQR